MGMCICVRMCDDLKTLKRMAIVENIFQNGISNRKFKNRNKS